MNQIKVFLCSFIMVVSLIIVWNNLLDKKINLKDYRIYISIITLSLISALNNIFNIGVTKIIFITIIFMAYFRFLFKKNVSQCIIGPIFYQIIIMLSEALYAIILVGFFNSTSRSFFSGFYGSIVSNIIIALITFFISSLTITKRIYRFIIINITKMSKLELISLCISILLILSVLPVTIYFEINQTFVIIFYSSLIVFFFAIMIYNFKIKNNLKNVSNKYNVAINTLNDYENMMIKYRISNHENKNLLLTVRAMILNKEKNIAKYIDNMIENKYEDNEKLMHKINKIPYGPLRATIYSEIMKIEAQNIKYELNISNKIKSIKLIELNDSTVIDICKIIGVFIDNSMQETVTAKENKVFIDIYELDNKMNIKISNNITKKINLDKIYNEGYTTKGSGHGYGLSLVKKIVLSNKYLENKTEINNNMFSQILIIKK